MAGVTILEGRSPNFCVVGIGASAGGIAALQTLFKSIPAETGLAFVVAQHSMADQPSRLARLFQAWTSMPVREAAAGVALEPGVVFISPPGQALGLDRGAFTVQPTAETESHAGISTIDFFFESLAREVGSRAVAVVLSGTGVDGAAGAVCIKRAGGMVFVQDPSTAMHDGMPSAAIANGAADHVMPLDALAEELIARASPGYARSTSSVDWADNVTEALDEMVDLIRDKAGIDLAPYKTAPLVWRIQRRMQLRRVPAFQDYAALLHDDPTELESLIRAIPIHVTDFFRDPGLWEQLEREVIPRLFEERGDGIVRAWTPACSTGEEAYSLAMLFAEQTDANGKGGDFQIFATDASAEIVARAGRGVFKTAAVNALGPERRQRFFYAVDGAYRVKRGLRETMVFAPQDVLADPPFMSLDLVTCRNLLIYLEPDAAKRVIYLLHSALRTGGYLFLGKSESLWMNHYGFEEVAPQSHVYRKTGAALDRDFDFPKRPVRSRTSRPSASAVEARSREAALVEGDRPAVVIDDYFQLVRVYGDTGAFLRFKPGEPTLNALHLLPPWIAEALEGAVSGIRSQENEVLVDELADPTTGRSTLGVRITSLQTPHEDGSRILVSFIGAARGLGDAAGSVGVPEDDRPRSGNAVSWSEALRLSHEELESSREELQALNEELRAANDQLNATNEELNHANAELHQKIDELETHSNVLSSGAIVSLFLDEELRMRWFTSGVSDLFPVRADDVGRRITDLAPKFDHPAFIERVRAVMRTGEPSEAVVRTFDGKWYLKHIRPIRTANRNDGHAGVAITFTDITDRKRAEEALRDSEAALGSELDAMKRLHAFSMAAIDARSIQHLIELALDTIVRLHGADMGTVQLYDPKSAVLHIAAQHGFDSWFVDHFAEVDANDGSVFGQAIARRERVSIPDVELELDRSDQASRELAKRVGYRAVQSTPLVSVGGRPLGMISTHFRSPHSLTDAECRLADILAFELSSALDRIDSDRVLRDSEGTLRRNEVWLTAQNEAFQAAMNGAPLEASLGILARAAIEQSESERRCAFYIADPTGSWLRHLVGMSESYARCVDGFEVSPESLACGLAVATGAPVITRDVLEEPRWQPWTWLARDYGYRGCWSFPVETSAGRLVGSFAMYLAEPREPTPHDREMVGALLEAAAIIISKHQETREVTRPSDRES